jgi:hypothetical protein
LFGRYFVPSEHILLKLYPRESVNDGVSELALIDQTADARKAEDLIFNPFSKKSHNWMICTKCTDAISTRSASPTCLLVGVSRANSLIPARKLSFYSTNVGETQVAMIGICIHRQYTPLVGFQTFFAKRSAAIIAKMGSVFRFVSEAFLMNVVWGGKYCADMPTSTTIRRIIVKNIPIYSAHLHRYRNFGIKYNPLNPHIILIEW